MLVLTESTVILYRVPVMVLLNYGRWIRKAHLTSFSHVRLVWAFDVLTAVCFQWKRRGSRRLGRSRTIQSVKSYFPPIWPVFRDLLFWQFMAIMGFRTSRRSSPSGRTLQTSLLYVFPVWWLNCCNRVK